MTFKTLYDAMTWINPPALEQVDEQHQTIRITTSKNTDFWQNTHYGFQRDDGHFLGRIATANFLFSVKVTMQPQQRYDQAGLMLRLDTDNWAKTSVEYIPDEANKLGSVVTKKGYSDWATTSVPDRDHYYFRIIKIDDTVYIATAIDGEQWETIRMFHVGATKQPLLIGVYACSPQGEHLSVEMSEIHYEANFTNKAAAYS